MNQRKPTQQRNCHACPAGGQVHHLVAALQLDHAVIQHGRADVILVVLCCYWYNLNYFKNLFFILTLSFVKV